MRRIVVLLVSSLFAAVPAGAQAAPRHFPGQLIVKFRPSADAHERARVRARLDVSVDRSLGRRDLQLVELERGQSVRAARAAFERTPEVEYAEPNYRITPDSTPNDPQYEWQWSLGRTGVPAAWEVTRGEGVVVAVLDSGVDLRHPDLVDNAWTNPGETGAGRESNRIDDDGNGYVDDWRGWDFAGDGPPYENDPIDYSGHGTNVAGVLGAVGDNGIGLVGVSPRVRIMPLAIWGGTAALTQAIDYANDFGVRIANGSFGIPYSNAVDDALRAAPNLLLTVSAGNQAWDAELHKAVRYPCVSPLPNVICVAATDHHDDLAGFSNWGAESVDLGAPGVSLPTTGLPQRSLLYETFDGPLDPARWTVGGTGGAWATGTNAAEWGSGSYAPPLHDSPGAPYPNDADSWVMSAQPLDLTGADACGLSYGYNRDLADAGDRFLVEASAAGVPWTTLAEHAGPYGPWPQGQHALTAFEGRPGFRFRFRLVTDGAGQARGVAVGWPQVYCRHAPFRGDEYPHVGGTSNAAPQVAGTAALLLASRPWLTRDGLRAAILDNVEPLPALAGRTVTGGRLNAQWAVAGRPPPEQPRQDELAGDGASGEPVVPSVTPDLRAPACRAAVARGQTLRSARRRGVRLTVRCDEAAALGVRARVSRGRRPVAGSARGALRAPGARALRIRVARRWLRRALPLELRVVATDAAGNRRTLVRRLTLRG